MHRDGSTPGHGLRPAAADSRHWWWKSAMDSKDGIAMAQSKRRRNNEGKLSDKTTNRRGEKDTNDDYQYCSNKLLLAFTG